MNTSVQVSIFTYGPFKWQLYGYGEKCLFEISHANIEWYRDMKFWIAVHRSFYSHFSIGVS